MELTQIARERGAKIILVTRFSRSPGAAQADVVLPVPGQYEGPLPAGAVCTADGAAFYRDMLYNEFIRRDPEQCHHNRSSSPCYGKAYLTQFILYGRLGGAYVPTGI